MRIVFDTNVLIAAHLAHGACAELVDHCAKRHLVFTSEFILHEFRGKLVSKFDVSPVEADEAVRLHRTMMKIVEPASLGGRVCRDPDDDAVIGTAVAGKCRCIVTGDKDLLILGTRQGIRMLSPLEFWTFETTAE